MIEGTPFFLTVDTEGDHMWDKPNPIVATNVGKLYRFQELCNSFNIKPIYLTNYEAAINKDFQDFVNQYKNQLEIGLHLHAWNSPPLYDLTGNDFFFQPYLHEYPDAVVKNKIDYLVSLLKDTFQTEIISHRGGRYSISELMLENLYENGIRVDCSVVPGFNWTETVDGNTRGIDFRTSSKKIHEIYPGIIEIPVTTYCPNDHLPFLSDTNLIKRVLKKLTQQQKLTLRSKKDNLNDLKFLTDHCIKNELHMDYIIHSSELVAGTSHLLKNEAEEDLFFSNLTLFFEYLKKRGVESLTFKEYMKRRNEN